MTDGRSSHLSELERWINFRMELSAVQGWNMGHQIFHSLWYFSPKITYFPPKIIYFLLFSEKPLNKLVTSGENKWLFKRGEWLIKKIYTPAAVRSPVFVNPIQTDVWFTQNTSRQHLIHFWKALGLYFNNMQNNLQICKISNIPFFNKLKKCNLEKSGERL